MGSLTRTTLVLLSLVALGSSGVAPLARDARGPELGAPLDVSLAEVRAEPGRYLGRRVRIRLQFSGLRDSFDPYLSRFGPKDWTAIEVWPDEDFLWEPQVYDEPARHLFLRRGLAPHALFAAALRYRRFEMVGVVREVFLEEPWIEVETVAALGRHVGEGTILHVVRAQGLVLEERWKPALEQFERALSGPLPEHARAALEEQAQDCRSRVKPERR